MPAKKLKNESNPLHTLIKETVEGGKTLKVAKAMATIEGYSDKDINSAVAELGLKGKRVNFIDGFYDFLASGPKSEEEVKEYVMADESQNVKNSYAHYKRIGELAQRIWESK